MTSPVIPRQTTNSPVRAATARDGEKLAALLRESDQGPHLRLNAIDVERALTTLGTETVFVVEIFKRLIGYATVQLTESFAYTRPTAELTNIFVLPGYRRGGLGSRLLSEVIAYAEKHHALELFARVNDANAGALQFYESLGLKRASHSECRIRYYREEVEG